MLLAGENLNIFLLTGILNINIFFIKKKVNVVVHSNIHDKFSSKNITYKLKKKKKKKKGKKKNNSFHNHFRQTHGHCAAKLCAG